MSEHQRCYSERPITCENGGWTASAGAVKKEVMIDHSYETIVSIFIRKFRVDGKMKADEAKDLCESVRDYAASCGDHFKIDEFNNIARRFITKAVSDNLMWRGAFTMCHLLMLVKMSIHDRALFIWCTCALAHSDEFRLGTTVLKMVNFFEPSNSNIVVGIAMLKLFGGKMPWWYLAYSK